MKNFEYVRATTVPEAVSAAAEPGAVYLAAGTNLLDLMKLDVMRPELLVDVNGFDGKTFATRIPLRFKKRLGLAANELGPKDTIR